MVTQTKVQSSKPTKTPSKRKRLVFAALFAIAGLAIGFSSYKHYRKVYSAPKPAIPILDLIPVAGKDQQKTIQDTIAGANQMVIFLPAEQREKAREIWKEPPKTLDELILKQQRMDAILTPKQRERAAPIRKFVQNKIVDELFEPGRSRIPPAEFEKLKAETKRRVEQRISGK